MADYKLTPSGVLRASDGAAIPDDARNADWQTYQAWLGDGNTPDAADVIVVAPVKPTPRAWLERLSSQKQAAIAAAGAANPAILLWLLKAAGETVIDVTGADCIAGLAALVQAGILTTDEQTVMLTP